MCEAKVTPPTNMWVWRCPNLLPHPTIMKQAMSNKQMLARPPPPHRPMDPAPGARESNCRVGRACASRIRTLFQMSVRMYAAYPDQCESNNAAINRKMDRSANTHTCWKIQAIAKSYRALRLDQHPCPTVGAKRRRRPRNCFKNTKGRFAYSWGDCHP